MAVGDAIHLVRNKEVELRGLVEDLHQLVLVRCMSYGVFCVETRGQLLSNTETAVVGGYPGLGVTGALRIRWWGST